ncbi:hypothetical protein ACFVTX_14210 [Agromyces sp. NPDC058136]|uniref:hypothetical protein n=1 Tax=Agromyces sp. NPDC058136 TaxID=3346354 RepID=UPI0036DA09DF
MQRRHGASRANGSVALLRALGVAALVALASLGGPQAAVAHGGKIVLDVDQDGTGGVTVSAVYEEDGHPVSEIIDPVLTAKSEGGGVVGPTPLVSAPEGEGFWVSSEPLFTEGSWDVTVTITSPRAAEVKKSIEFVIVDQTPVAGSDAAESGEQSTDWVSAAGVIGIGALVLLAIAILVAVIVRNRRRKEVSR